MADSESSISKEEAEVKTSGDEVKEDIVDSGVKPAVEELSHAAKSLVENVTQSSSHVVTEVENEVEKLVLVSDPWASLKNLGSSVKETEETLPTSDENVVGESQETVVAEQGKAGLDENTRNTHTQPFVAVSASTQVSWMNCCGLLDVLRPSDQ